MSPVRIFGILRNSTVSASPEVKDGVDMLATSTSAGSESKFEPEHEKRDISETVRVPVLRSERFKI